MMITLELSAAEVAVIEERRRQVEVEGFDAAHDDEHTEGELALVAAIFAAPEHLVQYIPLEGGVGFVDPWPDSWDTKWDKRPRDTNDNETLLEQTDEERLGLLIKAGALILAEIDRLFRKKEEGNG